MGTVRLFAQNNDIKLKLNALAEVKEDTQKVNILNEIAFKFYAKNIDSTKKYALQALEIAKRIDFKKGIGKSFCNLGIYYSQIKPPNKEKALEYLKQYLSIAQQINDYKEIGNAFDNLSFFYFDNQDYLNSHLYSEKALTYFRKIHDKKRVADIQLYNCEVLYYINKPVESTVAGIEALNFYEQNKDSFGISVANINLSLAYDVLKNHNKALEYSFKALGYTKKIKNNYNLWVLYNNIGDSYESLKDFDKALKYYNLALEKAYLNKLEFQIGQSESCLANIYYIKKDYEKALKHISISLKYIGLTDEKMAKASSFHTASKISLQLNKIDDAIKYANSSLNVSHGPDGQVYRIDSYDLLSQAYEKRGDYKTSLKYHKLLKSAYDSIYDKDVSSKLMEMQTKYESEKKENENILLRNQQELKNQVISSQYTLIIGISAGFVLLIVLTFILIRINSHRKKMLKTLSDQKSELEDFAVKLNSLNITKDKFFSIIAHDLKNPFQALLGINSMLVENPQLIEESLKHEYLVKMYDTTKNAYTLLENLLQWSRTQMGRMEFSPEKMDIFELIENNRLLLKSLAEEKSIQLNIDVKEGMFVFADHNMMDTILRNLLVNAIKFTNDKGQITVAAKEDDHFLVISVTDNGIGISAEDQESLFELGNGLTTRGTKNEKGSGLGLILCKEFVGVHGGKIWVQSQKDSGSTFFFTVPKFNSGAL